MDVGNLIKAMKAAGCTDTQILDAIQVMDEERRARGRARVAKHRNNKRNGNVTGVTNVTTVTSPSANIKNAGTRVEDNLSNSKKDISSLRSDNNSARAELAKVLDEKHVAAVLEHRKGFKGKFSAHAAGLLAAEFAKCPDPNAAADEMIRRNWQGFKAEWMKDQRGHDPPGSRKSAPTAWERQAQAFEEIRNERQQQRPDKSLTGPVLSLPRTGTDGE